MRIVLLAVALALTAADDEPTYKGKPASYWLAKLGERDAAVRKQGAEGLGFIGPRSDKAVPALRKALEDDNDEVREAALVGLGKAGAAAKPAVPALIAALQDRDPSYRKAAAQALGEIGPAAEGAVPALVRLLRAEKDPALVTATIRALSAIGPGAKEALPAIEEHVLRVPPDVIEALSKFGPEAVPLLVKVKSYDGPRLLLRRGPEGVRQVARLLKDPDPSRRQAAARTLEQFGIMIQGPAHWGFIGPTPEERAPHDWYLENVPLVQRAALRAACRTVLPTLAAAKDDADTTCRTHALLALAAFKEEALPWVELLVDLQQDRHVSPAATLALIAIGPDAVPALLRAAKGQDPQRLAEVERVLVYSRPVSPQAVPLLLGALRRPQLEREHDLAVRALAAAGPEALPAVLAALKSKDRPYYAFRVFELLGPKAKDAVPALIELLQDSDPAFRGGAARALGHIGPAAKEAAFALLKLAEEDRDFDVRRAAAEAVKKIR